ncbi:MAG: hypothetical protein BWY80_00953 [Firmicutes bacterium ADurb.Bin456]|nr:MAG: hypothetical protein BWY80_00953 [Firmicutes bacterium ADurb.Bin456]
MPTLEQEMKSFNGYTNFKLTVFQGLSVRGAQDWEQYFALEPRPGRLPINIEKG